jgi:hypothetical protein
VTDGTGEPGKEAGGTGRYALALAFARVAGWSIVPLYVAGICTNYVLERGAGLLDETDPIANVEGMLFNVGFGAFAVVGAMLLVKRPANPIGWIMAAIAFMLSVAPTGGTYATYVMVTRGQPDALATFGAWVVNWFWFLFLALALVYLPMLFPDGRLLSRRWLPVAIFAGIAPMTVVVLGALREALPVNAGYKLDNPIGIEGLGSIESLPAFGVLTGLFFVGFAGVVASVVVRFRRSRGVERQQMKWFTSAIVALVGGSVLASVVSDATGVQWLEDAGFWLSIAGIASLPVAVGIAILRYRLYEIDTLINRTLVYGSLTAMLVLIYLGGVVSLQYALRALTGQESQLAIVASTLTIAALFNPLRRRVQAFVDQYFYRKKYDARKTLEVFSGRLRDETDLDVLCDDLTGVVRETMQPALVSLWLRPDTVPKDEQAN